MNETIVMIHGMWGGGWCWEKYRNFFEQRGYRCITPTLRFHDMAPNEIPNSQLGTFSLLDYAKDLEREIHELDVTPVLMGHSMGGLLAQILASRGLGKSLVLLNPSAPYGIMALKLSVIKSFWSILTKWGFWKKPMRQTFREAVYSIMQLLTVEDQKELFEKFVYESGRAGAEIGFWFLDSKAATKVDESKITCPVLIVAGSKDRITPVKVTRKVADKYRFVSTYREFPDHAHWIIEEPDWQEIASYISIWLNRV